MRLTSDNYIYVLGGGFLFFVVICTGILKLTQDEPASASATMAAKPPQSYPSGFTYKQVGEFTDEDGTYNLVILPTRGNRGGDALLRTLWAAEDDLVARPQAPTSYAVIAILDRRLFTGGSPRPYSGAAFRNPSLDATLYLWTPAADAANSLTPAEWGIAIDFYAAMAAGECGDSEECAAGVLFGVAAQHGATADESADVARRIAKATCPDVAACSMREGRSTAR